MSLVVTKERAAGFKQCNGRMRPANVRRIEPPFFVKCTWVNDTPASNTHRGGRSRGGSGSGKMVLWIEAPHGMLW